MRAMCGGARVVFWNWRNLPVGDYSAPIFIFNNQKFMLGGVFFWSLCWSVYFLHILPSGMALPRSATHCRSMEYLVIR